MVIGDDKFRTDIFKKWICTCVRVELMKNRKFDEICNHSVKNKLKQVFNLASFKVDKFHTFVCEYMTAAAEKDTK